MSSDPQSGSVGLPSASQGNSKITIVKCFVPVLIAALVLSFVYAPLQYYIPIIYANLLIAGGLGWAVGKVAIVVLRKHKINSLTIATALGAVGGLVATYFAWVAYFMYYFTDFGIGDFLSVFWRPFTVLRVIQLVAHNPVWVLGKSGSGHDAIIYYLVWIIELAIIVGVAVFYCRDFIKENLLCGKCNDWVKETGDIASFSLPEDGGIEAISKLSSGNISVLADLPRRPPEGDEAMQWIEAKGYACPNCQDLDSYVTITLAALVLNKKSKEYERKDKVLSMFVPVSVEMEKKIFEPAEATATENARIASAEIESSEQPESEA